MLCKKYHFVVIPGFWKYGQSMLWFGLISVSGMIVTSALIIWKALMCATGSESPVVVVLSGSMEPGFKRVR